MMPKNMSSMNQDASWIASLLSELAPLWDESQGDPEIRIAILDGPVDLSHPCFQGANLTRLDTLVPDSATPGAMSAHGTHVASAIFGQAEGAVPGIAAKCQGLILPVFRDSQESRISQLDLARAIEQAVQAGAHIINISGGERSPQGQATEILARAIRLCEQNNILVVAAVGNDGCECLHVPAALPGVLAVGALSADGQPLDISNWGQAYRDNGVLAPGENIPGAAPGGGKALLTGSSFAAPIVSGVAALLLSIQRKNGIPPDPGAIREAILKSATTCNPDKNPDCSRYLAGVLNIPGAHALIKKGAKMSHSDATPIPAQSVEPGAAFVGANSTTTSPAGVVAAGVEPSGEPKPVTPSVPSAVAPNPNPVATPPPPTGVVPAGNCGCSNGNGTKSNIYAIGTVSFDFGTEARRDTFRQLMPRTKDGHPPNPYDATQLCDYLDAHRQECIKLTWTLNLDLTPIYAVEAEIPYADDIYKVFRSALRGESLISSDDNYVSRVSIPGVLTSKTRRLFSGQVVPVVTVQGSDIRGLYTWNETQLMNAAIDGVIAVAPPAQAKDPEFRTTITSTLRSFLDRIYYELRNLGQSSPDRALNYSATNVFQAAEGIAKVFSPTGLVPTLPKGELYMFNTVSVAKSPFCRMDSDCWDVQLTFFDPENERRAQVVLQYTVDVSDVMPVTLAPTRMWTAAS